MSRRLPVLSRLSTGASTATVINAVDPENRLGRVVMNPPRALMEDLDSLPFPAWDLIPIAKYTANTWFPNKVKQYVNIFTSRGCPYGCTFCGAKATWTRMCRAQSPENVVAEMQEAFVRLQIPDFFISDDLFTLKRDRVMAICELILKRRLPLTWTCLSRVNTIDLEMLALMKRAGCYLISSSPRRTTCSSSSRSLAPPARGSPRLTESWASQSRPEVRDESRRRQ